MCVRKLLKVSGKTFLGSVMVNCKCQFEWAVGCPDEALSLGMPVRLFLSEVNMSVCGFRTSRLPSPMCLGIIQFWGAWLEQKRVEAGINPFFPASLLELEHLIPSSLALRCGFLIGSAGAQVLGLGLNHTIAFPQSPACRQLTVGLLSLHGCRSQVLVINLLL